jgi:hypothetical protein
VGRSLTRWQDCRLQLLLTLASTVILGYKFRGMCDHILLSQITDFPFHCLLQLTGLQWRYLTPPSHGITSGSESESELLYDWQFTTNYFVLAPSPLRLTPRSFFELSTCGNNPYVTSSLMRGLVCCWQLLLVLASTFILRSESHKTHDHILMSQI